MGIQACSELLIEHTLHSLCLFMLFVIPSGSVACYARSDGGPNTPQEAGASCSAVIEMQVNQRVWVQSVYSDQVESPDQCNFSGFLIRAY